MIFFLSFGFECSIFYGVLPYFQNEVKFQYRKNGTGGMMVLCKKILITLFAVCYCFFGYFLSPSFADCFSTTWPHEKSDLQPDPSLIFGRLDNGFRYILKRNTEPENRVAMSLDIQAGSLNETEEQRGLAHFLEHMLFNGSTHFPPGKLIEYFQSIGMSFGGDTNAHTGYDETVYDIILPHGDKDDIEKGLLVFSDYARGALLLQSEIDRERGVILAEKRSRDSAGYRAHVKETEFSMKGTMVPERMPIGVLKTLNGANHSIMKKFYDAWYRPENMILVMVGDFNPRTVQPLIEEKFSKLTGAGEMPTCPDLGKMDHEGVEYFYHHEPEMGTTETSIECMWNVDPVDDSVALEERELMQYMGTKILQYRLDELSRKKDIPFTSASNYSGRFLQHIGYAAIGAKSEPDKWKDSLVLLENTLRQTLEYGFTEDELDRVQKELRAELDSKVLTANSRNSKQLASTIIRNLNSNRVIQSPEQERELIVNLLKKVNLSDIEKAFREIWSKPGRMIKVNGNAAISENDPLSVLKKTYTDASKEQINVYKVGTVQKFPYLHLENRQSAESFETFPDIGVKRLVFPNNVVLNLKQTRFQENELQLSADFGLGRSSEVTPGLAHLATVVLAQSGTGTLSKNTLDRIVGGSSIKLNFHVQPASFSWRGKALSQDTELLFQLVQSVLVDPGIDTDAFQVSMDRFRQSYQAMEADVAGVMTLRGDSFLAGGNKYFGLPPWEEFSKIKSEQIADWIFPAAKNSSLEISIVGDFNEEEVIALAEKYFSVLQKRNEQVKRERMISFPEGETLDITVPSSIDKAMLVLAWKTDDFWDIKQTRGLHLLAEIFSDKMRRVIREKLSASYSPQVYNVASKIYKDYGVMKAVLIVDPSQIEMLQEEVLKISNDMWAGKITETELQRAKGPMLTSLKDMVRSNEYWLNSVLSLSKRNPEQLLWPISILTEFEDYEYQAILELGKKYLSSEKVAIIKIIPE
jgi:zinc protease